MLTNEKYIGLVRLLDSVDNKSYYLSKDNHKAIISEELFNRVQEEKKKRSNVVVNENGTNRKNKKYSSKK